MAESTGGGGGGGGPDADAIARAEELKGRANEHFKGRRYGEAEALYSEAIALHPSNAILYANRSACHVRMENAGSAIADAQHAIELDPSYLKGYYRLGSGHLALGKYREALGDFAQVVKRKPKDKDALRRYKQCKSLYQREQFERAIASDRTQPVSETIDLDAMTVPAEYDGPHLPEPITLEFVQELMAVYEKQGKLHKKYVFTILLKIKELLVNTPPVVDVSIAEGKHVTVFGDVHGQYFDLVHVLRDLSGVPSEDNVMIFNGDLVDRGSWSVEVIMLLFAYKVLYPNSVHIARGNHETKNMNKVYGFEGEVKAKYDEKCMDLFTEIFQALPLVHLLNSKVFITHGGLFSSDGVMLDEIRQLNRFKEPPDSGVMCELLWSDPLPGNATGRQPSKRGVGIGFGKDVTEKFLADNDLELVVRSHEVRDEGYSVEHDGKLITIFSAPNYCDQVGNKGAFIRFGSDLKPQFTQFTHVPHPDLKPMAYASTYTQLMT
eukprot:TRINITY_DN11007_c0_g2_i1.p1 TRINITY_DN11007_c0_g2~~TRINITY_DN11007_c0_g2_i1.p1  ORF type:complete len:493 (+),score=179.80 TRINITY_DN11007_c0_g2_i1:338-1816(+)